MIPSELKPTPVNQSYPYLVHLIVVIDAVNHSCIHTYTGNNIARDPMLDTWVTCEYRQRKPRRNEPPRCQAPPEPLGTRTDSKAGRLTGTSGARLPGLNESLRAPVTHLATARLLGSPESVRTDVRMRHSTGRRTAFANRLSDKRELKARAPNGLPQKRY